MPEQDFELSLTEIASEIQRLEDTRRTALVRLVYRRALLEEGGLEAQAKGTARQVKEDGKGIPPLIRKGTPPLLPHPTNMGFLFRFRAFP